MVTDPIGDLLVRLRNGARRHHEVVTVPASRLKREVLRVLQSEGFIQGVEPALEDGHPVLKIQMRYIEEGESMITGMARISKPGCRIYVGSKEIPKVRNGIGVSILSTSKGVMTDRESRHAGLGGEILCSVW